MAPFFHETSWQVGHIGLLACGALHVSRPNAPWWVETDAEWGVVPPESCHLHTPQAGLSFLPALRPSLLFQVVDA